MTGTLVPPLLADLQPSCSLRRRLLALKALKNEIIGHEQTKELWVTLGVLPLVVQTLQELDASPGEPVEEAQEGSGSPLLRIPRNEQEETRLQAIVILDSFARGGTPYIYPLVASDAIRPLLAALSPFSNSSRITLAALRTLNSITSAVSLLHPGSDDLTASFFNQLFSNNHVQSLADIIDQRSSSTIVQEQITLAASLIAKACHEENHRQILADSNVLNSLSARLASFVMALGYVIPRTDSNGRIGQEPRTLPVPAPKNAKLMPILEAVATIIQDSKSRALRLVHSPALNAVFPWPAVETGLENGSKPSWESGQTQTNPIDLLLPQIPSAITKAASNQMAAFPPLGPVSRDSRYSFDKSASFPPAWTASSPPIDVYQKDPVTESPLIAWLLHLTREESGMTRLMAASVLVSLHRAGLTKEEREAPLALMVVPYLVSVLDDDSVVANDTLWVQTKDSIRSLEYSIKERAPAILAALITDSGPLQKAAVDANAIPKLAQLLKNSFEPIVQAPRTGPWRQESIGPQSDKPDQPDSARLGPAGYSLALLHRVRVRESTLMALASLAPCDEEYRKAIVEQGVTPYIVDSLRSGISSNGGRSDTTSSSNGNVSTTPSDKTTEPTPAPVLIAASAAVRALSRSVGMLRTGLIDAGVAVPLFHLLQHRDMEVKIAATAAVCNLVLEFSPMKEPIMKAGVLMILCEHAHSVNLRLRLNAVWALKHVVYIANNVVRRRCLEELGQGWLIQLIENDTTEVPSTDDVHMEDQETGPNSSSEKSRDGLLNIEGAQELFEVDRDDVMNIADSVGIFDKKPPAQNGNTREHFHLKEFDDKKVQREDVAIQEQVLDFIRNLICPPGSTEMIDFLLTNLGQDRLFSILMSKFRPKILPSKDPNDTGSRTIQPREEIILASLYIIVHLAGGEPRHRQLLLSQPELFKLLLPLFDHPNKDIRTNLGWLVINLTWMDDESDRPGAKARALELKKLGFVASLERIEHDSELDVKERVKTALYQIKSAIE